MKHDVKRTEEKPGLSKRSGDQKWSKFTKLHGFEFLEEFLYVLKEWVKKFESQRSDFG